METQTVTLANEQEVEVGQISWAAWKKLKTLLSDFLAGPIIDQLALIFEGPLLREAVSLLRSEEGWSTDKLADLLPGIVEHARDGLPDLSRGFFAMLDDLTPVLVQGCCDLKVSDLAAVDALAIRDAALEVNDFSGLLESEKNLPAVMASLFAPLLNGLNTTETASPGGSDMSTPSPQPTAGVGTTSGTPQPANASGILS